MKLDILEAALTAVLGDRVKKLVRDRGELTVTVSAANYIESALLLRGTGKRFCSVDLSWPPSRI